MWEWQGLMDSNHRWLSQRLLPFHLAKPLLKRPFTGPLTQCVLSAEGLYRMAGVDGIKPPFADLESTVLLTELNSYDGGTNGYRTHDLLRDRQAF